jgi:hypothetical protein
LMCIVDVPGVATGGGHRERLDENSWRPDPFHGAGCLSSWRHKLAAYVVDDSGAGF